MKSFNCTVHSPAIFDNLEFMLTAAPQTFMIPLQETYNLFVDLNRRSTTFTATEDVRYFEDVRYLKDNSQEQKYRNMAAGLFGRYIKNGCDATNRVADELYEALAAGTISESEITQVLAADLLWGGQLRPSQEPIVIVMEASWLAEVHDVERAAQRCEILRRIGIASLAVVGGQEWAANAADLAEQLRVVTTQNGHIDHPSWERAMNQQK